jgi:hypothetical protein
MKSAASTPISTAACHYLMNVAVQLALAEESTVLLSPHHATHSCILTYNKFNDNK